MDERSAGEFREFMHGRPALRVAPSASRWSRFATAVRSPAPGLAAQIRSPSRATPTASGPVVVVYGPGQPPGPGPAMCKSRSRGPW